jgi:hypothetical protein
MLMITALIAAQAGYAANALREEPTKLVRRAQVINLDVMVLGNGRGWRIASRAIGDTGCFRSGVGVRSRSGGGRCGFDSGWPSWSR